jgi:hypothetical protein
MSQARLSLGTRQLLAFLRSKSGAKGYCWWKQNTIARAMERGLRTVNRQVSELVAAGDLKVERQRYGNHYRLRDLAAKLAYLAAHEEKPVESAPVGVSDTPIWRIWPTPVSITEFIKPENRTDTPATDACSGVVENRDRDRSSGKPVPSRQNHPEPKPRPSARAFEPSCERRKTPEKASEFPMEAENHNHRALVKAITTDEYLEFSRHCARLRLAVPPRSLVAELKQRFAGDFRGRPAFLQLPLFPRQDSAFLWRSLDREQVFMEMERQAFSPPRLTDKEIAQQQRGERIRVWAEDRDRKIAGGER